MSKEKCVYCGDPIYKFQEKVVRYNPRGGKTEYHKGCNEILLRGVSNTDGISNKDIDIEYYIPTKSDMKEYKFDKSMERAIDDAKSGRVVKVKNLKKFLDEL